MEEAVTMRVSKVQNTTENSHSHTTCNSVPIIPLAIDPSKIGLDGLFLTHSTHATSTQLTYIQTRDRKTR